MSDDTGLFTDGSALNKAFVDQIYDQIDAQAHSTTNPTVTPKASVDEVVAARGSKASLDARLDVVLEEDGTLKTQASLVTAAQVQSGLGSRNVATNGDLADWTAGGASAPDNFTLTGAAATIARTGPAMGDTFTFGTGGGGFAAKITRAGTDWKLTQDVIAAADFAKFVNVKGQKVSVAVKGKTAIAALLRIVIDDGVSTDASTYHTGGDTEEHLSVTHTISNSATKISVYVEGTGSNGDAYVGGFTFVFADLAPSDWSPLSVIGDASATSRGQVNTTTQTLAGIKTLTSAPVLPAGLTFASAFTLLNFAFARSTADLTKNASVAFSDITGLVFSIGANETWVVLYAIHLISNAAADAKFQLVGPAAPTAVRFGGSTETAGLGAADVTGFSTVVHLSTVGTVDEMKFLTATIRNGANAGTVQLQAAQDTSNASNSIFYTDSSLIAFRIA
jgi:hypothetical protein